MFLALSGHDPNELPEAVKPSFPKPTARLSTDSSRVEAGWARMTNYDSTKSGEIWLVGLDTELRIGAPYRKWLLWKFSKKAFYISAIDADENPLEYKSSNGRQSLHYAPGRWLISEDHHFWSLIILPVTASAFLLATRIATNDSTGLACWNFKITCENATYSDAFFEPTGLFGLAYWFVLYLVHSLIFGGLIRRIAEQAMSISSARPSNEPSVNGK